MTCYRTEYIFSVRTDDPLSERMNCSQTESLFSVRNPYFLRTLYFRTDCLFPVRMTPRTIDFPYEWLPERMPQLCLFSYADLVPNRLSMLRTNGWPVPEQNIYSSYERMTPFPNGWPVPKQNIYSPYELPRVLISNKNLCMFLVIRNGNEILIWSWNNSKVFMISIDSESLAK